MPRALRWHLHNSSACDSWTSSRFHTNHEIPAVIGFPVETDGRTKFLVPAELSRNGEIIHRTYMTEWPSVNIRVRYIIVNSGKTGLENKMIFKWFPHFLLTGCGSWPSLIHPPGFLIPTSETLGNLTSSWSWRFLWASHFRFVIFLIGVHFISVLVKWNYSQIWFFGTTPL